MSVAFLFVYSLQKVTFTIRLITLNNGGCGEGVNTPGCEPGIRQFKSDHPPQHYLISLLKQGFFY